MGTCCDLSNGTPLTFSGKRLLHCTEEWSGRRVVAVAFTLMRVFSIDPQLDQSLSVLGFNVPDSLEVDFYVREIVGPGQPVQLRLNTRTAAHVWQAGKLKQGLPTTLVLSDSEEDMPEAPTRSVPATVLDSVEVARESVESHDSGDAPTLPWPESRVEGG